MGWALLGLVVSVYGLFVLGLPVYLWLQAKRLARIEARLVELEIGLEEARVDRFEARAATPPVVRGREEESPIVGDPEPVEETIARPPAAAPPAGPPPREEAARPAAPGTVPPSPGPPPPAAPSAAPSAARGPLADLLDTARGWLLGGNTVARVGVLVLLVGVAFFLRYSLEQGWIPPELRLIAGAVGGFLLVGVGWRLRARRRGYALVLQGGGLGLVYLTVFAAVALYEVLAAGPGLILLVVLVALGGALAVLESARSLATLAAIGGFLAPVLLPGEGSHVVLFAYYAVLNLGVLGVAWFRAWRELNLVGFVATFGLAALWGHRFYGPEHFATTEPFLVLFFLQYLAVPVLFAWRRRVELRAAVDGTLVFGLPLVAFGLQSRLVEGREYGLAISALVAGLLYVVVAAVLWRRARPQIRPLVESFVALAVAFGTVAIPLAVDGRWTGAAWALEGAALLWTGARQRRLLARLSAVAVQIAAGVSFALEGAGAPSEVPLFDAGTWSAVMIGVAGLFSAWTLASAGGSVRSEERSGRWLLLVWGLGWWLAAGLREIEAHAGSFDLGALLVFLAATAGVFGLLRRRAGWRDAGLVALTLLPVLLALAPLVWLSNSHRAPTSHGGGVGWLAAVVVQLGLLRGLEGRVPRRWLAAEHAGTLWLLLFLAGWEASWAVARLDVGGAWLALAWVVVAMVAVATVPSLAARGGWPVGRFPRAYTGLGLGVVVLALGLWSLTAAFVAGSPRPLPYLPLANPLELGQALAVLLTIRWLARPGVEVATNRAYWAAALVGFAALNGAVARAAHWLRGVPWDLDAVWGSAFVQTTLSIVWTLTALAVMVAATRLGRRVAWIAGATLLGAVVVKLALVDLADTGTVARIVSFVGVGLLMLVAGYLSPMPPADNQSNETAVSEESSS